VISGHGRSETKVRESWIVREAGSQQLSLLVGEREERALQRVLELLVGLPVVVGRELGHRRGRKRESDRAQRLQGITRPMHGLRASTHPARAVPGFRLANGSCRAVSLVSARARSHPTPSIRVDDRWCRISRAEVSFVSKIRLSNVI
jgi:hypothetical protein